MIYAQLRAFHAVAVHGNFSRAADALCISQPAVSAQVKALESAYGVTLFERRPRGVRLTGPGHRLLEITRGMFRLEQEAEEALRAAQGAEPNLFRLGSDAPYSASRLLSVYCQAHPGLQVSLVMGNAEEIQEEVINDRLDAALLVRGQDDPRLLFFRYAIHRIVAVVPKTHPWAGRPSVALKELHRQRMVLREARYSLTNQTFEAALKRADVHPDVVMRVDNRENLREGVAAGLGIGVTTEADAVTDDRIVGLPIDDPDMFINDYVVCLKERSEVRAIANFLDLARAQVRSGTVPTMPPSGEAAAEA